MHYYSPSATTSVRVKGYDKPNSITLASSELMAPNMFGASSELAPNQLV